MSMPCSFSKPAGRLSLGSLGYSLLISPRSGLFPFCRLLFFYFLPLSPFSFPVVPLLFIYCSLVLIYTFLRYLLLLATFFRSPHHHHLDPPRFDSFPFRFPLFSFNSTTYLFSHSLSFLFHFFLYIFSCIFLFSPPPSLSSPPPLNLVLTHFLSTPFFHTYHTSFPFEPCHSASTLSFDRFSPLSSRFFYPTPFSPLPARRSPLLFLFPTVSTKERLKKGPTKVTRVHPFYIPLFLYPPEINRNM
ncbi:unnamed protein product [Acanthosepion pharaonis]|uniref:Uncharacterized protein n=1 Tax=Acanthosepion pharaonis TaxID=158019 RepID=A0A812B7K8_ACAPH|nr:unnamed protein product [Sepia pharaonis]